MDSLDVLNFVVDLLLVLFLSIATYDTKTFYRERSNLFPNLRIETPKLYNTIYNLQLVIYNLQTTTSD